MPSQSVTVDQLDADALRRARDDLVTLLQDAVDGGASLGFLAPLAADRAAAYWDGVVGEVATGGKIVLAARRGEVLQGAVQLALSPWEAGRHRAVIQKLMVHSGARRRGLGTLLMEHAEGLALDMGRTLILLDTRHGSAADTLYRGLGYIEIGVVPRCTRTPDGAPAASAFYYKELG